MSQTSSPTADFEALLRQAFQPVEPPPDLALRMEQTLENLTGLAQEELEAWELSSMRDPRNWVRPVAAAVVGTTAGTALVLLRVRNSRQKRVAQATGKRDLVARTVSDLASEARRVLDPDDRR